MNFGTHSLLHISIQQFHDLGMKNWKKNNKMKRICTNNFQCLSRKILVCCGFTWRNNTPVAKTLTRWNPQWDETIFDGDFICYCISGFLNSLKNLMKHPSWFNVHLVWFKSSWWFHQKSLAILESFNHVKTFKKLRNHFMKTIVQGNWK